MAQEERADKAASSLFMFVLIDFSRKTWPQRQSVLAVRCRSPFSLPAGRLKTKFKEKEINEPKVDKKEPGSGGRRQTDSDKETEQRTEAEISLFHNTSVS
jgi:hypothetical protein